MDGNTKKGLANWKTKLNSRDSKDFLFWLALITPALLICILFILIPIIDSVVMSFTTYKIQNLVNNVSGEWNNFANYIRLWQSGKLQSSIIITLKFVISEVLLTFIISMTLALILNSNIRGARLLRSIMMIPWIVPTVIAALLWSWIFSSPYGLLKYFVGVVSNGKIADFAILNNTKTALWGVAIAALWKQIPLITLLLLAGLQNVPDDIMEAAKVDGATGLIRLVKITIPSMKSVIKVSMTMCIIENFKQYPLFAALTNGGPSRATTTLAVLSYDEAFANYNYGSGAAVTTVWLLIMIIVVIIFNRIFKSEDMS